MWTSEPWEPRLRYHAWVLKNAPAVHDLTRQRLAVARWPYAPTISIITPVYDTPPEMLRRMVASVRRQSYPHWELCLVDDGSPSAWMRGAFARFAASDSRIRVASRSKNGGIVAASNDALALATGEFVALLDDDDELDPRALFSLAREIVARPDVDLLYTDFDVIGTDGVRYEPVLAPAWSPELLLSIPYIVHLTAYRRELVHRVGGFRREFEGSQDYDLALRVTRATDASRIVHVPEVLYHWRAWKRSAAGNPEAKPYAYTAGVRAITEHLRGHAFGAWRQEGPANGLHVVRFAIKDAPLVSVIVPLIGCAGDDEAYAARMLESLPRLASATSHRPIEFIIAGRRGDTAAFDRCGRDVRIVDYAGPADATLAAMAAVSRARGDHLLFLGAPLEPLDAGWLTAMLEYAQQPRIGAVGAKIYRQEGYVWHAGVIVPHAVPHLVGRDDLVTRNYAAVSGACLLTSRRAFEAIGGFRSTETAGCSDIDYCLRLHDRGERIVFTPHARLRCAGDPPPLPIADAKRIATFQHEWADRMTIDPFYNRNFRQDGPWFVVGL